MGCKGFIQTKFVLLFLGSEEKGKAKFFCFIQTVNLDSMGEKRQSIDLYGRM
jgi:hypothetical protein